MKLDLNLFEFDAASTTMSFTAEAFCELLYIRSLSSVNLVGCLAIERAEWNAAWCFGHQLLCYNPEADVVVGFFD